MALRHAEPALAVDAASGWPGGPGGFGRSELMRRIGFTLGALIVFRVGSYVPIPGLNPVVARELLFLPSFDVFHSFASGSGRFWSSSVFQTINEFTGSALDRVSIFALGVMPYLSALMVMHLFAAASPAIGRWKTRGADGRRRFDRFTRYGTLALAAAQGYAVAIILESSGILSPEYAFYLALSDTVGVPTLSLVIEPGWFFRIQTMVTIACGTMFLVWLGEQITARGVGNGIALIILVGLAGELPRVLAAFLDLSRTGAVPIWLALGLPIMAVVAIALLVVLERARRRIVAEDSTGRSGLPSSARRTADIPLRLYNAGILPPIFATLLMPIFPGIVDLFQQAGAHNPWYFADPSSLGMPAYMMLYAALIMLFCFLLRTDASGPADLARSLKNSGRFIIGIRPGKRTADYLRYVQLRLTMFGAGYLAGICVLLEMLGWTFPGLVLPNGTGMVIMVLISSQSLAAIAAHMSARQS